MVNIAFTNRNPHSLNRRVVINIATGRCVVDDKRDIELKYLLDELDFVHPLLTEPFIQASDHVFHYEYNDVDGLFYSAIFVYSTLLKVDNPHDYKFKIYPSHDFQRAKFADDVYFSINCNKVAKGSIRIEQLNAIASQLRGLKFEFSEDTVIDELFTMEDLPDTVDGDALYNSNSKIIQLLKTPSDFQHYEIRYINSKVGFGVYSRDALVKGDIVGIYSGVKRNCASISYLDYSYKAGIDALNMYLDARSSGNLSRFINHAPSPDTSRVPSRRARLLEANVKSEYFYSNGINVVAYVVTKEIVKGEQLLVDYGQAFFEDVPLTRFKTNGRVHYPFKQLIGKNARKNLNQIRVMANQGVKEAQRYMRIRLLGIVGVIAILMGAINYM